MNLTELNGAELDRLYTEEMTGDFPADELRPLRDFQRLRTTGRYWALEAREEDDTPVGYALMWESEDGAWALLDYLAVLRGKRNGGIGGRILDALTLRWPNLVLEAEDPDCTADPVARELRLHRLGFYGRNGFRVMDYDNALFGVRFKCLYRGSEGDGAAVLARHAALYDSTFVPARLACYCKIPLWPGEATPSLNGAELDSLFD